MQFLLNFTTVVSILAALCVLSTASDISLAGIKKFYPTNMDRETLETSHEPTLSSSTSKGRVMRSRGIVIDEPLHPHEARKLAIKLSEVHHMAAKQSVNRAIHVPAVQPFKPDPFSYSESQAEPYFKPHLPVVRQYFDTSRPSYDPFAALESNIAQRNLATMKNSILPPTAKSSQDPQMVLVFAHSVEIPLVMTPPATRSSMYQQLEQPSPSRLNNRFSRKADAFSVYTPARPTAPYAARMEEAQLESQAWPQLLEMIPFTRFSYMNEPLASEESRVAQWQWMPKAEFLPYQQVARAEWAL